jgi:hypothetical protein
MRQSRGQGAPGNSTLFFINRAIVIRLLCVALVAGVMLPLGSAVFPYVSHALDGTQFQALEAVLSATLGFGIYSLIA